MAKKLYEEENIRAIANKLREFTLDKEATFTVKEMPVAIASACQTEYEDGYDRGYSSALSMFQEKFMDLYTYESGIDIYMEVTNYNTMFALHIEGRVNAHTGQWSSPFSFTVPADDSLSYDWELDVDVDDLEVMIDTVYFE